MPAVSKVKSQNKQFHKLIADLIDLYNQKLSDFISQKEFSLDELNKLSASISKILPDLLKLKEELECKINKRNDMQAFDILKYIKDDEKAMDLLQKLMMQISISGL